MRDILLLAVTLAAFAFGFFVVKIIDAFIDENNRMMVSMDAMSTRCVRIASENPAFFDAAAPALAHCSASNPCMDFCLSSAHPKHLLRRLSAGSIDIALLSEENAKELSDEFGCTPISYCVNHQEVTTLGLTVGNTDDQRRILLVWNKAVSSKDRDRVLFALENGHLQLECSRA